MVELLSLGHFVTAAAGRSYAPLLVLGWSSDTTRAGSPPALGCAPEAQGLPGLGLGGVWPVRLGVGTQAGGCRKPLPAARWGCGRRSIFPSWALGLLPLAPGGTNPGLWACESGLVSA